MLVSALSGANILATVSVHSLLHRPAEAAQSQRVVWGLSSSKSTRHRDNSWKGLLLSHTKFNGAECLCDNLNWQMKNSFYLLSEHSSRLQSQEVNCNPNHVGFFNHLRTFKLNFLSFAGWLYEIWSSETGRIETVPDQSPAAEVQSISQEDAKHPHLGSKSFRWQGLTLSLGALRASQDWVDSASVTPFTQMEIMTWQAKSIFIWSLSWDLLPEVKDTGQYPSMKLNNLWQLRIYPSFRA